MTTRDEIIALAGADKFCSTEYEEYTHECYEFSIEELERFYHAAQRQAYERAANVCEKEAVDPHNVPAAIVARRCSDAIRALIEGEGK